MAKPFEPYKYFLNRLIHTISLRLRTNTYENEVLTRRVASINILFNWCMRAIGNLICTLSTVYHWYSVSIEEYSNVYCFEA